MFVMRFQLMLVVVGLCLGSAPARADHEPSSEAKRPMLEQRSVTCGDHWYKVKLYWASGSTKGKATFSGDSRPERDSVNVKVTQKAGILVASFEDAAGGEISLSGLGTNSISGTIRESEKSSAVSIGPCYRTK